MKLTCYVTSTSPWFLYAASVSLCFFFFARSSRVTCGVTTRAASYCGVDRPCQLLLHHHYVSTLPLNTKYGEKPLGRTGPWRQGIVSRNNVTEVDWVRWIQIVFSHKFPWWEKSSQLGSRQFDCWLKNPRLKLHCNFLWWRGVQPLSTQTKRPEKVVKLYYHSVYFLIVELTKNSWQLCSNDVRFDQI